MSLININFASEVLGRCTDINIVVPQRETSGQIGIDNKAKGEKYKTLVLLHGLSDDHSIWLRRTSIERYATECGIAVICPNGERSFYTDMKYGDRYYTYISEEVLKIAEEYLPISTKREDTFIAGNSMGGYGALKIALKNPDRFCAAAGLSSVADIKLFMEKYTPDLKGLIFGDSVADTEDLFCLARKTNESLQKPRIYMATGTEDFMYEENVNLRKEFEKLDYDYTYKERAGVHNWAYWDEQIQDVLRWMNLMD